MSIEPFLVHVPDEVLDDLRDRLARTRWVDQLPGTTWEYGADVAYLRGLCEYWATTFDVTDHVVVRGKLKYVQVQFGHRVAYVKLDDVRILPAF